MREYEIMMIVNPNNDEAKIKEVSESMEKVLSKNGASKIEVKSLGKKELAYEVKKHNTGFYFLYNFETENPNAISEFDRLALIDENILRHMILKLND